MKLFMRDVQPELDHEGSEERLLAVLARDGWTQVQVVETARSTMNRRPQDATSHGLGSNQSPIQC